MGGGLAQQLSMFGSGAVLTRAPAFSSALPHAAARWRERGGLLVVPRREAAARALLDEAAGGEALLGREAVTFAGLRGRVAAAAGAPEPAPPAAIEVRLALREVLDAADLSAFGDSARAPGFLSAVERAIGELREARVPPARAAAAATTPVAAAVAAIHAAAAETVPLPSDAVWAAADAAHAVRSFPPVTVSGFDDLVPGQWALLHALARHGAGRGRHALRRGAAGVRGAPDPPGAVGARGRGRRAGRSGRGGRAARAGGAPVRRRAARARWAPPVRLVAAAGTRGMLRAALDEALAAVDGGVALSQVALVVPRLAEVRDDLERLLDDWAVPARLTSRVRVLEAPLALALTHLLRLGELAPDAPGALDHLLGWLRSPYSGADPAQVNLFEAGARRGGIATRGELMGRWAGVAIAPARRLVAAARQGPRAQLAAMVERRLAGAAAGGRRRRPPRAGRPARPRRPGGPRGPRGGRLRRGARRRRGRRAPQAAPRAAAARDRRRADRGPHVRRARGGPGRARRPRPRLAAGEPLRGGGDRRPGRRGHPGPPRRRRAAGGPARGARRRPAGAGAGHVGEPPAIRPRGRRRALAARARAAGGRRRGA